MPLLIKKTICVVEDDPDISDLIAYLLDSLGFRVINYATVNAFDRRPTAVVPDLLILDIMLPDGSGLDICRRWKEEDQTRHVPVLMMSAHSDGKSLAQGVAAGAQGLGCDLLVCPPFTAIEPVARALQGTAVAVGGQDCHTQVQGAHTGDVSAAMLRDAGASWVILGHSERRQHHGESDELVREKVQAAVAAGLIPIVCVGETETQRASRQETDVVGWQLATHMRPGRDWFTTEYFCEQHAGPADQPIPLEHVFRRVQVFCDVYFAGVAVSAPVSHTEAVARLESAIRAAGGAIDVHQVRSYVVRSAPQTSPGLELVGRERLE